MFALANIHQRRQWLGASVAVVLSGLCGGLRGVSAADRLRIAHPDEVDNPLNVLSEAVLRRAYREIGLSVEFMPLPTRRALQQLLSGQVDGNTYRVAELATEHQGLVRIDPPIVYSEIRAYGRNEGGVAVGGWPDLAGRKVIYQRGVLAIERALPAKVRRVEGSSDADCFRHLANGTGELVVVVEPQGSAQSRHLPEGFRRLDAVLATIPLHHYLHIRHRALAVRLGEAVRLLEASGELSRLRQKVLVESP